MNETILTQDLSKTYFTKNRKGLFRTESREVEALKKINLEVKQGEIFGLLGPNGAGKTTLIKLLTTLLLPTSGSAQVNGYDVANFPNQVRGTTGCMLMGERGLYWKMTGRENLEYFGALYHLSPKDRKNRAKEILGLLSMEDLADRMVETYSSGQKMKLAFAKSLINDAPLLILDEPTNTLDVPSASELRAVVRDMNREGKTIIYTTHIMAEAETLCDRVAIIDYGELLALGTVDELKTSLDKENVTSFEGVIPSEAVKAVEALPFVSKTTRAAVNGHTKVNVVARETENALPRLIETLGRTGAVIQKISPEETTLEDVFIAKTGRTLAEDTRLSHAGGK